MRKREFHPTRPFQQALKIGSKQNTGNISQNTVFSTSVENPKFNEKLEILADTALRRLLEKVPTIQIEDIKAEAVSGEWTPDMIVQLLVEGRRHQLICSCKSNGQPRIARPALLELRNYIIQQIPTATPVFIAPYISPAVRQLCIKTDVSYVDLEGNARITFSNVFIERMITDRPAIERRELKSLFRPKSAQVLRAMLREPNRAWRVSELSKISSVSLGHVSNVRTGLLNREWAHASKDGLVLSEPDALLDAWRDSYTAPSGERLQFYTPLHGSAFEAAARSALRVGESSGNAAFASFSAAQWLAPYGRTGTHYFFADEDGLLTLQTTLKLAPAAKGENIIITIPKDEALLSDTIEPAPGAVCTSLVQTYLDLSIAGERGIEAANHLRREKLSWPK